MSVFKHSLLLTHMLLAANVLADQCRTAESVTSFGAWFSQGARLTASQPFQTIKAPTAEWPVDSMKLRLEVASGTDRQWHLLVYAPDYRVLASFGPNDFSNKGQLTASRWTGRLPHDRVQVELVTARPDSDTVIKIPAGIALPKESSDQRVFSVQTPGIVGWNDLFPTNGAMGDTLPRKAGAKIGMLMTARQIPGGDRSAWCCSVVMIGPGLALTNWHCGGDSRWMQPTDYWEGNVCVNATLDLAWDGGTIRRQYNCTHVEAKNEALDYAVLRVQPVVGTGGVVGEPVYERLASVPEAKLGDAFIVHHSMCQTKQVSDKCKVLSLDHPNWLKDDGPREITHDCDTEHGASGAAVFNARGQVVALHHLGFRRDPQTCERQDTVNKAVPLSNIIEDLKANTPALAKELGL
ncbi:trypsin-like serine peptidase [Pseudomonas asplenii]|uniref:trypsin-like serine peptidase n=1 Tax=Pseudomonas asplenii TaxID=53407 RepID=UPI0003AA681A|nr:serine protease [Pseudomonas fuscovaginae]